MKDVARIAQEVSAESCDGQANGFFISEKAAQGVLQERLIASGYGDTVAEEDINIRCGTMQVVRRVDLLTKGKLLVELKLRDNVKRENCCQLEQYVEIFNCDYGLLILFPKTADGRFRVEVCMKELNAFTQKERFACSSYI